MSLPAPILAADRSMRSVDVDGHMRVEMSNISKANVCGYYGREIPGSEALGLLPNKVYRLYRDPAELRAAADSFAGKPLLLHHQPVTADEHPAELVVGSVGTDVQFDGTYLRAPLMLWTAEAVTAVESAKQKELSPGYRYRVDMTAGHTPEGVAFDGSMRDIKGNHVALVAEGRTGHDVVVADEKPLELSRMKFSRFLTMLRAALPTMADEQVAAMDSALATDIAQSDLSEDEMKAACDAWSKANAKAMDAMTDEDKADAYKRAAADKIVGKSASKSPTASEGSKPPQAADEAAVKLAVDAAVATATAGLLTKADADKLALDAVAAVHALYDARKAVETVVGVVALDSAEAVFRFALDHLKVDHKATESPALAALFDSSAKAAAAPPVQVALDSAVVFDPSILGTSHIRKG